MGDEKHKFVMKMKKIKLLVVLLVTIFLCVNFVACDCESKKDEPEVNPFVGTWNYRYGKWEFKEDWTYKRVHNLSATWSETRTGTYTYNETSATICLTDDDSGHADIYIIQHLSTNKIVIYNEDFTYSFTRI